MTRWMVRVGVTAALACTALVGLVVVTGQAILKRSEIAFVSERNGNAEIYTVDLNHRLEINLTTNSADDYGPVWSPDGAQLAFVSTRDGNSDIYVLDMSNHALRNVSNHPAEDRLPVWSPDGRQIAFVSNRDGNGEIYVVEVSTNWARNISLNSERDDSPAWSPDGSRIVFESHGCCGSLILAADLTLGQVHPLREAGESLRQPLWSPDGERIFFLNVRDDASNVFLDTVEVVVANADGSDLRPFLDTGADENSLVWSPDGETLALALLLEEGSEIYLADRNGRQGRLLRYGCEATGGKWTGAPSWSPDSEQLTFESGCGGSSEIYVVDTNGGNLHRLTYNAARDSSPVWRP